MADVFITTVAILTFVVVERRPRPAHLITSLILALLTGVWIWANLRPVYWQQDAFGDLRLPKGLDPVTKGMFYRGWPVSPCWFGLVHGMKIHASGLEPAVLVLDWAVLVAALSLAKFACERQLSRRNVPLPATDHPGCRVDSETE